VQTDLLAVAGILVAAIGLATVLMGVQRILQLRSSRPLLPAEDRPPEGLGRLIPVGAQVEEEYRRGVIALEHWLLSHRQAGRGGA
jgi:hypothetical protein